MWARVRVAATLARKFDGRLAQNRAAPSTLVVVFVRVRESHFAAGPTTQKARFLFQHSGEKHANRYFIGGAIFFLILRVTRRAIEPRIKAIFTQTNLQDRDDDCCDGLAPDEHGCSEKSGPAHGAGEIPPSPPPKFHRASSYSIFELNLLPCVAAISRYLWKLDLVGTRGICIMFFCVWRCLSFAHLVPLSTLRSCF